MHQNSDPTKTNATDILVRERWSELRGEERRGEDNNK